MEARSPKLARSIFKTNLVTVVALMFIFVAFAYNRCPEIVDLIFIFGVIQTGCFLLVGLVIGHWLVLHRYVKIFKKEESSSGR